MASALESARINILSWNIRGLKAKLKDQRKSILLNLLGKYNVVLLQETHIGKSAQNEDADWKFISSVLSTEYALEVLEDQKYKEREDNQTEKMYMSYFESDSKGVAIIINKPHNLLTAFCEGGDYAWVHVEIDTQKYTFVSVYYKYKEPDLICDLMLKIFYSFLTDGSDAFKSKLVIGGDFNTSLIPGLDASRKILTHSPRNKKLNRFMTILKMTDVWRNKHKKKREYTRTDPKNKVKSRLDYVFMFEKDVGYVESCDICKAIDRNLSDHFPVSLTLKNETDEIFSREE